MKRSTMQVVVDYVNVQSDMLYEVVRDESAHPQDRVECRADLKELCTFMMEVSKQGFNVDNGCYKLADKIKVLED